MEFKNPTFLSWLLSSILISILPNRLFTRRRKANLWDKIPRKAINTRFKEFGFEDSKENDALRREYMQAYHACISFIDAQIKIVLDSLKESGEWEKTIVIFHVGSRLPSRGSFPLGKGDPL